MAITFDTQLKTAAYDLHLKYSTCTILLSDIEGAACGGKRIGLSIT